MMHARVIAPHESDEVLLAIGLIVKALNEGHLIWWFGNGGSASQADHLSGELSGRFRHDRPPLGSVSLVGSTATMTAIANDYGYDQVFSRPLLGVGRPGDVAIGLSTSGRSRNVLLALNEAGRSGLVTILLRGPLDVGEIPDLYTLTIEVAGVAGAAEIQEEHLHIGHTICAVVEQIMFGGAR